MVTTITTAVCLPDTSAIDGTRTNLNFGKKLFSWNELRSYFGYRNAPFRGRPSPQPPLVSDVKCHPLGRHKIKGNTRLLSCSPARTLPQVLRQNVPLVAQRSKSVGAGATR